MRDIKTKKSFEKRFKETVKGFDETKIWFEHPSNFCSESKICFVQNGKLVKFPIYKSQYYIDLYAWNFEIYLQSGEFPLTTFWVLYDDKNICPSDIGKVFGFDLKDLKSNVYTIGKNEFLSEYRLLYPACGIKQIPKPLDFSYFS